MGLLTRKTESNPLSKNIDELLDGMHQEKEEAKEGTYEDSLKKIEDLPIESVICYHGGYFIGSPLAKDS